MRKMDWVPQIIFDDDRKRFDVIIDRVKKFQEEHPNSKNAKSKEEKKTAEDKYCSLVSFAFEQFGWYLY